MKNKWLVFATLGLLASCTADMDDKLDNGSMLTKKWFFKETVLQDGTVIPYAGHQDGCSKDYIEFVSGGVFNSVDLVDAQCTLETDTGNWEVQGNNLTITFAGDPDDIETSVINLVTATNLQIKLVYDRDGDNIPDTVYDNFTAE